MSTPLGFLSFDVERDEGARGKFITQLDGSSTVTIDRWSMPPSFPRDDWCDLVRTNISRCNLMITLTGEKSVGSE